MVKPIFTLDEDAVKTLKDSDFNLTVKPKGKPEYTLGVGTQFAVVSRDKVEVRATMIDAETGKPKRGRPRRFPLALVTRLLGEDNSSEAVEDTDTDEAESPAEDLSEAVVDEEDSEPLLSEEEQLERQERLAALFSESGASELVDDF